MCGRNQRPGATFRGPGLVTTPVSQSLLPWVHCPQNSTLSWDQSYKTSDCGLTCLDSKQQSPKVATQQIGRNQDYMREMSPLHLLKMISLLHGSLSSHHPLKGARWTISDPPTIQSPPPPPCPWQYSDRGWGKQGVKGIKDEAFESAPPSLSSDLK